MLSDASISRISNTKHFTHIEGNWQIRVRTYQNAPTYKCVFYHSRNMSSATHHTDQHRLLLPAREVLLFPLIVVEDPPSVDSCTGNYLSSSWSQWQRSLRRRSAAARLLTLWVRIPPGYGCLLVVSVVCCQLEVSATNWSLVLTSSTYCGASLWVI